jgi:hypothetical protein
MLCAVAAAAAKETIFNTFIVPLSPANAGTLPGMPIPAIGNVTQGKRH